MNEKKEILFKPEFELYHELLLAYCEQRVYEHSQNRMTINYDEENRVLEFGTLSSVVEAITFNNDGAGNITMSLRSSSTMTDDGNGNVVLTGVTFSDNGYGNVYIS